MFLFFIAPNKISEMSLILIVVEFVSNYETVPTFNLIG